MSTHNSIRHAVRYALLTSAAAAAAVPAYGADQTIQEVVVTGSRIAQPNLETSGVDLNLNYTGLDVGSWGSLNFNLTGTFLNELITDPGASGFPPFDCTGLHAGTCVSSLTTAANPEIRSRFRIGWETPWNVDLSLTWRYYGAVTNIATSQQANIDYKLGARSFFDLAANWAVTEKASVLLGINNVLDKDPPISSAVGTTGNGNTFPQTYDALGRWIFMRGQVSF